MRQAPAAASDWATAAILPSIRGVSASVPNRLLVPMVPVIVTGTICADQACRRHHLHRLQIWRAAGELAGIAAGLFEQHVEGAADAARVERGLRGG